MLEGKKHFPMLTKAALRLMSMHTTTAAAERNWSLWGRVFVKARGRLGLERAHKLIYLKGNSSTDLKGADVEALMSTLLHDSDSDGEGEE